MKTKILNMALAIIVIYVLSMLYALLNVYFGTDDIDWLVHFASILGLCSGVYSMLWCIGKKEMNFFELLVTGVLFSLSVGYMGLAFMFGDVVDFAIAMVAFIGLCGGAWMVKRGEIE
ncbi:hypothetical protein AB8613_23930 [Vibrio sp. BS-M-Sm-2]|uniref:hypothetical protein n=1 Tax=Vibrio sp. BS-M-Sm-2 TaxID=3241167 RepID=UPI0035567725